MFAFFTPYSQKTMIQTAAGKKFVKFTLNIVGQRASLGFKGLFKYRVVLRDNLVE